MTNPLAHLYADFNSGDPAEKHANLADFPRMIDVELTSSCNFRCRMCPTGLLALGRPATFMARETFTTIIDQCAGRLEAMRFIGWGEDMLHPEALEFIHMASEAGILTHINTNGSKVTAEKALNLCSAGLDSIKFSFQGVDRESYKEMRGKDFFEGLLDAIEIMRAARRATSNFRRSRHPWIAVSTTTTWETEDMIAAFVERVGPMVDELSIGKTIFEFMDISKARLKAKDKAMLTRLKEASSGDQKAHPDPCPEVYGKLSVHADGTAVVCCNSYGTQTDLGSVNDSSIESIWMHPEMEAYRERLGRKDYSAPICTKCFDYLDLTEGQNDTALVK